MSLHLLTWLRKVGCRAPTPATRILNGTGDASTLQFVKPYTMTGETRIRCLIDAVRYVISDNVPGDFVECGVYSGGSSMAMAITLKQLGICNRRLWLYDTFCGMPHTEDPIDVSIHGEVATEVGKRLQLPDGTSNWCRESLSCVKANMGATGYPTSHINFIEGVVEETIPANVPDSISLLRLDTDWYSSTAHEMKQLFPRISPGGVLIIDDYGYWNGARNAVDEYFATNNIKAQLHDLQDGGAHLCVIGRPR